MSNILKNWKPGREKVVSAPIFGGYNIKPMNAKKNNITKTVKSPIFIISFLVMIMVIGIYFLAPGITGLFIAKEGLISYEKEVDWNIDSDSEYNFVIEEYPDKFDLKSLRLSGSYVGNGSVKAYIETEDGRRFMIFSEEAIAEEELSGITGLFIAEDMPEEAVPNYEISEDKEKDKDKEKKEKKEKEVVEEETEDLDEESIENEEEVIEEVENEEIEIEEEVIEDNMSETNVSEHIQNQTLLNVTEEILEDIEINETEEVVEEDNETEEINVTDVNASEEINVSINITEDVVENMTEDINESINVTEEVNSSVNVSVEEVINETVEDLVETEEPIEEIEEEIVEEGNLTEEIEEKVIEELIPLESYRNVEILDTEFHHEWKKSWGIITEVVLTIRNYENESVAIKYLVLDVEGYDEPYVLKIPNAKSLDAGEEREITIQTHFSYADKKSRKIRLRIKDENTLIITSKTFDFDPKTAVEIKEIDFSKVCVESCLLPEGLNYTEYKIIFEVNSGLLNINKIDYVLHNLSKPFNETVLSEFYTQIKEDPNYDAVIDLVEHDELTDTLTVVFHHDSVKGLPIFVKGNVNYELSHEESTAGENVTLIVRDWSNKKFRILVGEHTEAFEFGVAKEITINPKVKNAHNKEVEATIELVDSLTDSIKTSKEKGQSKKTEEGEYNIIIKIDNHPVKEVEFKNMNLYENFTDDFKIDDVPKEKEGDYVEVYAIDPTNINFTKAVLKAVAKGNRLYKCKDWNFTLQQCFGEWVFLQNIVPGQEYTVELTPEDPGLAESGGVFFEGFESGSLATNEWTTSGAGAAWFISSSRYQGSYGAEGDPRGAESILETIVDTSGYENIYFSFYVETNGLDNGEYIAADWYDGTDWINVLPQTEDINSFTLYNYSLESSANNNDNVKIRFRCLASNPNEDSFVDNIQVTGTEIICVPLLTNTTWTSWLNITCLADNTLNESRNLTQYDSNYCGEIGNITFIEYQSVESCDFCTPSLTNTTWTNWTDSDCNGNQMNQSRNKLEYDTNYCGEISNNTYYEYQLVGPIYQNTSWSDWIDISCLQEDLMNQSRNLTQSDNYDCVISEIFIEYKHTEFCDYCTPNLINSSWGEWYDLSSCYLNDTVDQERNRTQYDENLCGEVEDVMFFEQQSIVCDYCTPSLLNTSWSGWYDTSACYFNDTIEQEKNLTEYDVNECGEIEDVIYYEYHIENCDFCTPSLTNTSWNDWYDITACQQNNTILQERNKIEYDSNYCGEVINSTYLEQHEIVCDYCTPSLINTSWSSWNYETDCFVNDTRIQNRSKTEYDSNYFSCYGVTGLASDLWNSGNNNTYWEKQFAICDYCSYDNIWSIWNEWQNDGTCLINDLQQQNRTKTEYDTNYFSCYEVTGLVSDLWNSGNNNTDSDYVYAACDYCTPIWNAINTSCNTSDKLTQYYIDANGCYDVTRLPSDNNPPANSKFECDYCSYSIVNSSWSSWNDETGCFVNDTRMQNKSKTEYDESYNTCYEVTGLVSDLWNSGNNNTYWENMYVGCDYCIPNWMEINESCQPTDYKSASYNDENECFAATGLASDNNSPANIIYPCDYVISTKFIETNFAAVNLSRIENLILKTPDYGKINFSNNISIERSIDLDFNVEIGNNSIFVNSTALPELNVSAVLTIYNLNFINPIILKDGVECEDCNKISYVNGTFIFNVTSFSTYSTAEGPSCGDGSCNGAETCSFCATDCGACAPAPTSPSGGGGGSGGSKTYQCSDKKDNDLDGLIDLNDPGCLSRYDNDETNDEGCVEYWSCSSWFSCIEGVQARNCIDINSCETTNNMPLERRDCKPEDISKPEDENLTKALNLINNGKITGKTIEVKPQNAPNPIYLVPTILLMVLLVALIALRKTKLSKKMKKLISIMHIVLVGIIGLLLVASFAEKTLTGFSVSEKINISEIFKGFVTNSDTSVIMFAIAFFCVVLAITSFVLRRKYKIK